jgi:hypothetical protein
MVINLYEQKAQAAQNTPSLFAGTNIDFIAVVQVEPASQLFFSSTMSNFGGESGPIDTACTTPITHAVTLTIGNVK